MTRQPFFIVLFALLQAGFAADLQAQNCDSKDRPATAAERKFSVDMRRAMALMPPPPPGWVEVGQEESYGTHIPANSLVCPQASPVPIYEQFRKTYSRYSQPQWQTMVGAQALARIDYLNKSPIEQKIRALDAKAAAALKAGNFAGIEAVQTQRDALLAEQELDMKRFNHFKPDSFIAVRVEVNGVESGSCAGKARKITVAGATTAAVCTIKDSERDDPAAAEFENATAIIGFGALKPVQISNTADSSSASIEPLVNPKRAYTEVHSVFVTVNASPETIEKFIASANWGGLAGLVK